MTTYLQFASEAAARVALIPWTVEEQSPVYIGRAAVDVVGIVYRPTGEIQSTPEGDLPVMAPVPGWHINLSERVPELQQHEIEPPATPDRVFAGSDVVQPPRIPAEVARWQAKLALMQKVNGEGVSLWNRLLQLRESITDAEQQVLLDAALFEVL
ncbi:hypothetical protein, partial [Comamonas sp.]|uniref:hypothetical protein n=1 Tax=Comamonas sp. TaxID=34028 RepID=UPI003A92BDF5